jgi:hypothetical protein
MSRSTLLRLAAAVLVVAMPLAVTPRAWADDDEVHGSITAVDTTKKTVTFKTTTGTMVTVHVSASTRIEINGFEGLTLDQLAAAFKALPPGAQLRGGARVDNLTSLNALSIHVKLRIAPTKPAFVKGSITAVDTTKKTVTFKTTTGTMVTVHVLPFARIEINDREKQTLDQLAAAVKAVPPGGQPYSGVASVDNLTSLNAWRISVSNVPDDDER